MVIATTSTRGTVRGHVALVIILPVAQVYSICVYVMSNRRSPPPHTLRQTSIFGFQKNSSMVSWDGCIGGMSFEPMCDADRYNAEYAGSYDKNLGGTMTCKCSGRDLLGLETVDRVAIPADLPAGEWVLQAGAGTASSRRRCGRRALVSQLRNTTPETDACRRHLGHGGGHLGAIFQEWLGRRRACLHGSWVGGEE